MGDDGVMMSALEIGQGPWEMQGSNDRNEDAMMKAICLSRNDI